jgi:hypothetical protein
VSFDHEREWLGLKRLAEAGDAAAILEHIQAQEDPGERISLYRFTIRKLAFDAWSNKNLDVMTTIADAAIADCEILGGDYLQQANLICYNTSANLCDCWGDDFPRERRHFEKGIEYAKKALWFRDHLAKGPGALSMATWALGKHQQSLGLAADARASFERCVELEREASKESGKPIAIVAQAPSGYLIARGYLALMDGDREALAELRALLKSMEAAGGESREDAEIIAGQLQETAKHMGIADLYFGFRGTIV